MGTPQEIHARRRQFRVKGTIRQELKFSSKRVGQLHPILVDYFGNIVDGEHRYSANEKWRRVRLENIKTEKDRLIARIVSNNLRRNVSTKEKRELLCKLGETHLKEGIENGKIAYEIAEETGMSYTWVMKYLPDRFKDSAQSERRVGSVTRRVTGILDELLRPPKREGALKIKNYANTDFVSLLLERGFYEKFERDSLELGVSTELSALKALEDHHEKMKRAITLKNKNKASGESENHRT